MSNFTDPIKIAFGRYMGAYYAQLVADTPSLAEFAARGLSSSIVWAPGRMIDQVQEMLTAWRRNDTAQADQPTPKLPIMVAAMSKDYVPAPSDFSVPVTVGVPVTIPSDTKQRVFKMRAVPTQIRVQVAIFAAEESTERSLAMQLQLWASSPENRRFYTSYPLAGFSELWPVVLETDELSAVNAPDDLKNISISTVDIQLRATVPLLSYPKPTDPNDGKGTGTADDPSGYLVVTEADVTHADALGHTISTRVVRNV